MVTSCFPRVVRVCQPRGQPAPQCFMCPKADCPPHPLTDLVPREHRSSPSGTFCPRKANPGEQIPPACASATMSSQSGTAAGFLVLQLGAYASREAQGGSSALRSPICATACSLLALGWKRAGFEAYIWASSMSREVLRPIVKEGGPHKDGVSQPSTSFPPRPPPLRLVLTTLS